MGQPVLVTMPEVIDIAQYTGGDKAAEPVPLPPLLTLEQLRAQSQNVSWLVKQLVPSESIGILFGASGTFKSFIAIDMALHVAHGLPWLGRKTKKGTVLIVAAEGGSGLWRRIYAWHRVHRIKYDNVPIYVMPVALDLATDSCRVVEAAAALGVKPDLVVVDTMSQTFRGEENSAAEVSKYLSEVSLWFRTSWQAAVLLVHHSGHSATERARGSSAIRANVDWMFGVFRDEKEMLATIECVKQKDGDMPDPITFSMRVVDLFVDEDGEAVTSLVASGVTTAGDVVDLMQHEADRGRGGKNHLFLDLALNGIEEKKLRTLFYEAIDGDGETKRKAYYRARSWAERAGLVEIHKQSGVVIRLG
jgi:KaiC/GvpD/RAD55 family RecA-like ATPase